MKRSYPIVSFKSPSKRSIAHFTGKIYTDRTLTLGYRKKPEKGASEKEYDENYSEQFNSYTEEYKEYGRTKEREVEFFDQGVVPNRFIEGAKSSQKRGKYGSKGITGYGKRNVRCIALLLQQKYGRKRLGFGTTTLPPLTEDGVRIALAKWGDLIRRFFQRLKRLVEPKGEQFLYVSCTEIQPKRFSTTSLPFPHLHFAYVSRRISRSGWYVSSAEIRNAWRAACLQVIGSKEFIDEGSEKSFGASVDCQSVRKSVAGYLGKYLSKGDVVIDLMIEQGYNVFPRQWWSASMQCKKAFKKSIAYVDPSFGSDIFYRIGDYLEEGIITWFQFIEVEINERMTTIGLIAKLSKDAYSKLKPDRELWQ